MRRLAPAIVLVALVVACRLGAPTFEVRLASPGEDVPPLDVVVVDHAGVVTRVEPATATAWAAGVSRGDEAGQLLVTWTGGLCDAGTTLTITSEGGTLTIEEATEAAADGCLLMGVARGVVLELERDIAPDRVRLVTGAGS